MNPAVTLGDGGNGPLSRLKELVVPFLVLGLLVSFAASLVPLIGLACELLLLAWWLTVRAVSRAAPVDDATPPRLPLAFAIALVLAVALGFGMVLFTSMSPGVIAAGDISGLVAGASGAAAANLVVLLAFGGVLLWLQSPGLIAATRALYRRSGAAILGNVAAQSWAEVERVLADASGATRGERMAAVLDAKYSTHESPLLRGDLQAAAEAAWPPAQHRELHVEMPVDLVRSVVWDGMLITGQSPEYLAQRLVSQGHVARAYDSALVAAIAPEGVLDIAAIFLGAAAMFGTMNALALVYPGWTYLLPIVLVGIVTGYSVRSWYVARTLERIPAAALRPCVAAPIVNRIVNSRPELLTPTRDSIARRKERLDTLRDMLEQWRLQIQLATADRFALAELGTATGSALFRGDPGGYLEGQPVRLSGDDQSRGGVALIGPTGTGKSFANLTPFMAQVMDGADATESAHDVIDLTPLPGDADA